MEEKIIALSNRKIKGVQDFSPLEVFIAYCDKNGVEYRIEPVEEKIAGLGMSKVIFKFSEIEVLYVIIDLVTAISYKIAH